MTSNYAALTTSNSLATATLADSSSSTNSRKYQSTESTRELQGKSRAIGNCCPPVDPQGSKKGDDNVQLFGATKNLDDATPKNERSVKRGCPRTPPEPKPSPSCSSSSYKSESCSRYRSRHSSTGSQSSKDEYPKGKHPRRSARYSERLKYKQPRSPRSPISKRSSGYVRTSSKAIKRKTPEKIPYFVDQKREKERLKRIYGATSLSPEQSKASKSRHYKKKQPATPPSPSPSPPRLPLSPVLHRSRRRERALPLSPHRDISPLPRYHLRMTEAHTPRPRSPSPYLIRVRSRSRERQRSTGYENVRARARELDLDLDRAWHRSTHFRDNKSPAAPATQIITIPVPVPDYSYAYPPWSTQSPSWGSPLSAAGPSSRYAPYPPPYSMHQMVPPSVLAPPLRAPPPPPPPYGGGVVPMHHTRSVRLQRYGNPDYAPRVPRGPHQYRPRNAYT